MRERLIELIEQHADNRLAKHIPMTSEGLAEHLIANGVIVPPCKVGDTVFVQWGKEHGLKNKIYPVEVYALRFDTKKNNMRICVNGIFEVNAYGGKFNHYYNGTFAWNSVGKTVFLAREEAERALRATDNNVGDKGGAECKNQLN